MRRQDTIGSYFTDGSNDFISDSKHSSMSSLKSDSVKSDQKNKMDKMDVPILELSIGGSSGKASRKSQVGKTFHKKSQSLADTGSKKKIKGGRSKLLDEDE